VILYGKGYRFGLDKGKPDFFGTGLLVVTSNPDGAEVFIDNHLTTATNNTINLSPGNYSVRIFKDGYFPWEKKIKISKEVVSKAEALLFPTAPKLESITESGVGNPVIDPSYTKLAYTLASQSARKNGIYVLDMSTKPLITLQSGSLQVADDTVDAFSSSKIGWAPDGKNLIATTSASTKTQTTYLLDTNTFNQNPKDITETLATIQNTWQSEKQEKQAVILETLKPTLSNIVNKNFTILAWSPDETKILYQASQSATLPFIINPPLIGADTTPEERTIEKDAIYVYDIKEDKNFKILDNLPSSNIQTSSQFPLMWFPDGIHLISVHDKKIEIMEYDGGNKTTIYAGPFLDTYVFPWPNGSKIVILTNLNNDSIPPNLYTISLR